MKTVIAFCIGLMVGGFVLHQIGMSSLEELEKEHNQLLERVVAGEKERAIRGSVYTSLKLEHARVVNEQRQLDAYKGKFCRTSQKLADRLTEPIEFRGETHPVSEFTATATKAFSLHIDDYCQLNEEIYPDDSQRWGE